jgi:photosystem II stability/assembly factor-like uncharacterized protein
VRFLDDQNGWIAGTNGFLARPRTGGASWTPVALGTANDLNCVDARGSAAWVVGDNATAFRSSVRRTPGRSSISTPTTGRT